LSSIVIIYTIKLERVVLEYQLQNRVENLAWQSGKVFNPVLKLVFENYPFSCLSQLRSPHFTIKLLTLFTANSIPLLLMVDPARSKVAMLCIPWTVNEI